MKEADHIFFRSHYINCCPTLSFT